MNLKYIVLFFQCIIMVRSQMVTYDAISELALLALKPQRSVFYEIQRTYQGKIVFEK